VKERARAILVVDDETDFLTTYRRLLGRDGFRVVTASTCEAALTALARESFAVAIVDMRLPDGDGLEVVRHARKLAEPPRAIVVTGFSSKEARAAALEAGAADFLAKPFVAATLSARVRGLAE
jgi:two-component system response regulator PilR (NtrC family)